ncbi:MAG: hypothetical protein AAGB93_06325 [Planctomycetota bacterium]
MIRSLTATFLLATLSTTASAQVTPIVTETFEYPVPGLISQMAGGIGWSNSWFVSGPGADEIVMFDNTIMPMFPAADGVGGHAGQTQPFGAAFRQMDLNLHPELIDLNTNMWGADGNTLWVSFSSQNYQGLPQEHYGGLSLWMAGQPVPEALFLGSPWNSMGWGIDDQGDQGAPAEIVPGSDDTVAARLVYRIDFVAGDERLRMWIDPPVDYPTATVPDLDTTIADLRFDEIRLSSGGNNGDNYFWDDIEIAKGDPGGNIGTNYCVANANSTGATGSIAAAGSAVATDNDLTLTASDLPNQAFGFFLTSTTQDQIANPGGSAGNLCLGGAIGRYVGAGQIQNSGTAGEFSLVLDLTQTPTPNGLVTIVAGETWNFQAWHRDLVSGVPTSNFTDGTSVLFQ